MKTKLTIAVTLAICSIAVTSGKVSAADCTNPTVRKDVSTPTPLSIYGENISLASMQELWRIATATENATHTFGKVIARDQNWLDTCEYPGIGIGAGSGTSPKDRNVTLWIWSSGIDFAQAWASIYELIGYAPVQTTTSTSTTTSTTTTTLPPVAPTTTTSTTTTLAPSSEDVAISQMYAVAIGAPVKAQSITKVLIKKITAKKKKVVTIKVAPKKRKKK